MIDELGLNRGGQSGVMLQGNKEKSYNYGGHCDATRGNAFQFPLMGVSLQTRPLSFDGVEGAWSKKDHLQDLVKWSSERSVWWGGNYECSR